MAGEYSLWSFGIFFPNLVCFDQEKSGNPVFESRFLSSPLFLGQFIMISLTGKQWKTFCHFFAAFLYDRQRPKFPLLGKNTNFVSCDQKSQFGYKLEGLGIENVGKFYGHLGNFTAH
jgi:hypothetical protein